jgi:hypothetical protein
MIEEVFEEEEYKVEEDKIEEYKIVSNIKLESILLIF